MDIHTVIDSALFTAHMDILDNALFTVNMDILDSAYGEYGHFRKRFFMVNIAWTLSIALYLQCIWTF